MCVFQVRPDLASALASRPSELSELEVRSGASLVVHQDFEDVALTPVDITGTAEQVRRRGGERFSIYLDLSLFCSRMSWPWTCCGSGSRSLRRTSSLLI